SIQQTNHEMMQMIRAQGDQSEKLVTLHQRYMRLFLDMKRLEYECTQSRMRETILACEKDTAFSRLDRELSVKHRLERLCRELQRENKRIKDEGNLLAVKEQRKREELTLQFENALRTVRSTSGDTDEDQQQRQRADGIVMREKLRGFLEQYELREKHFNCVMRSKDLELQLFEARLAQQRQLAEQEGSKNTSLRNQVATFVRTEGELRKQLSVYVEKFRQVEETLNKSNELFTTFRSEMEQMTKKTKRLEKENATLRVKTDTMNRNILEMAEECKRAQKMLSTSEKKRQKLEDLCRALQ
ncbi:Taxilin family, partial [Thamnocephalis sphaerospora]